jgi:hypothetical protein
MEQRMSKTNVSFLRFSSKQPHGLFAIYHSESALDWIDKWQKEEKEAEVYV